MRAKIAIVNDTGALLGGQHFVVVIVAVVLGTDSIRFGLSCVISGCRRPTPAFSPSPPASSLHFASFAASG